ncbi:MAG: metal ABC transporter solute-binding protein, Zn/Mn family [Gemmobacter sp.]
MIISFGAMEVFMPAFGLSRLQVSRRRAAARGARWLVRSLVLPVAFAAALAAAPAAAADRPRIVATIGMIADMARTLAGDCAEVRALIGPGTDPHTYRATPSDVAALNRADVILYLGLGLEGQLAQVLGRLGTRKTVVAIGAAIPADRLLVEDGAPDPHVWMSPALWSLAIPAVAAAVRDAAPACAEAVAAAAGRHAAELAALDAWGRASLATIPADRRILVTAHDAFGYMGRDWDIRVEAIQGISTEAEASVADITQTARLVADMRVPAVFVESTINPRTIEALIAAARSLGHEVTIGGALLADAMGAEGTAAGTYIGMIHANVTAIAAALGGRALPLPEALRDWGAIWGIG